MAQELKVLNVSITFIAVVLAGYVLYVARDLFIPFAVALMIWYVINASVEGVQRLRLGGWRPGRGLALAVTLAVMALAIKLTVDLIGQNVNNVARAAPVYAQNLQRLAEVVAGWFGLAEIPTVKDILRTIDMSAWIRTLAATVSNFAGNFGLVLVYVIFLLAAQGSFAKKMEALFPEPARREKVRAMIARVQREIQTYIWIKTLVSILTGLVSYAVLAAVGVDFASFWAFVIFLLNYIPTIGSILGVVFPAALTVVQFGTPGPFLIVAVGLGSIQFLIGNVLEPKLQGKSMGLDPVALLLALIAWGMMWGVAGMFLSVPLTVIIMIILAQFDGGRPIAILMSSDGRLGER